MPRSFLREGWFIQMRDCLREQAAKNALTLFTMAVLFVITWTFILIATLFAVAHGS